jgi:hypothetical protein
MKNQTTIYEFDFSFSLVFYKQRVPAILNLNRLGKKAIRSTHSEHIPSVYPRNLRMSFRRSLLHICL